MLTKPKNQTKPPRRTRESLFEQVTSAPARIDRAAGIIRGVKILGKESKNGRTYSPQAMREAASLYEGIRVNMNHPSKEAIKSSRGIQDWIGTLENVTVRDTGVYGDLVMLKSHPYTPAIMESAERYPTKFGLSHNADCSGYNTGGKSIIESVEKVRSVDLVTNPATNSSLFESVLEMDGNADFGSAKAKDPTKPIDQDALDGKAGNGTNDALDSILTVIGDAAMSADEKLSSIKAIATAAARKSTPVPETVSTWRKPPRRAVTESALEFTDAAGLAALINGPATSTRPAARQPSRSSSLLEAMADDAPKSALGFKDFKGLAALIK